MGVPTPYVDEAEGNRLGESRRHEEGTAELLLPLRSLCGAEVGEAGEKRAKILIFFSLHFIVLLLIYLIFLEISNRPKFLGLRWPQKKKIPVIETSIRM